VAALATPPIAALAIFYVWPLITLVVDAVSLDAIGSTLGRLRTWKIIWFTLWQAVVSTVTTILVGLAPAWVIARFEFAGRRLLLSLLTAVFVLPTVVMGAAVLALLPDFLDRTVWAVIAAHVLFNLAVVVRTVGPVWEHLPTDMESAAATLGARPIAVFREITMPLIRPAVTAAAAIVFLFTFTSFGVVRVVGAPGTRTIEVEVWRRAVQLGQVDRAAVLSLVQLCALGVVAAWSAMSTRRHSRSLRLRPPMAARRARRGWERIIVASVAMAATALSLAPIIALVAKSMSSPAGWTTSAWTTLGSAEIRPDISLGIDPVGSLVNSVRTAAWATVFASVVGGLASLGIALAGRAGRVLDAGLMLPIGTSAVTIGLGMLITFDHAPFEWRSTWWIVPVGHALVAAPFVVRTTLNVLRAVDPGMASAASTLGASPIRAWRETVVPYLWRPLAVGSALAAAISLGEFGATSFLSRRGGETLPIAIEQLLGRTGSLLQAKGYALATILAAATIALVMAVDRTGGVALGGSASGSRGTQWKRPKSEPSGEEHVSGTRS
jgi:thiamine transport system permease protein